MPFILRKTISETFLARVQHSSLEPAFQYKPNFADNGDPLTVRPAWKNLTFKDFYDQTRMISFGLIGLGVVPGDKVAILSHTRIEWSMVDMAVLGARAITVPIYPSSTSQDVIELLNHSEARVAVVENAMQLEKILNARAADPLTLPGLEKIVVMEPGALRVVATTGRSTRDVLTLHALRELGKRQEGKAPRLFEENLNSAQPSDVITLCYTTGTTGIPKGVPLTHENLMSVIEDCIQRMNKRLRPEAEVILAVLPFSHVLGKVESMIFYAVGGTLAFGESPEKLPADLLEVRPTFIFAVPRMFEKAFAQIQSTIITESPLNRKAYEWALDIGRKYHEAFWNKRMPSVRITAQYTLARKMVFRRITERFGGRLRYAICGGAPLSRELGEFFEIAGIRILEGYGLTETCAPVTLNDPDRPHFGTVGKPLADVSVKIADDGEILLRSKKVFSGYYKDPEETARVLQDGWFHTGDIGRLDQEGYLCITDRKKDILIISTGKNVAPQKIENLAKNQKIFREVVVYGDQRPYLTALLTLDRESVIEYANTHDILFSEYGELIKNPKIVSWVARAMDEVNAQLARFETVKKFMILPNEFTVEGGELTTSLKVRRNVIYQRYREEFDSLYR